ncbi:MAG: 3-hydroxybutyrate dehydrogenase [Myxococcota bacterium]|nr:3-hydroxybutyrate dehydrogenase [Myxococcota bacterium]
MNLKNRRALVTGAASGIGWAIAKRFSDAGAEVLLSDLPGPALDKAVSELGGKARALPANLAVRDEVLKLAKDAGQVDVLINNAGLQHVSPIDDFDLAKWDLIIAVMLTAPFTLVRAALPGMVQRNWGRIINVSSVHGLIASAYKSAYVSAKHGVIGLTKTVALEAGARSHQVTCNAICPSYVRTPLVEKQVADQAKAHGIPESEVLEKVLLTQNAIKRLIEPAEVAEAAMYLTRDDAWSVTGSALMLDAGWLAH